MNNIELEEEYNKFFAYDVEGEKVTENEEIKPSESKEEVIQSVEKHLKGKNITFTKNFSDTEFGGEYVEFINTNKEVIMAIQYDDGEL